MKKILISMIFILCLVVAISYTVSAESTNKLTYTVGASAPTVSANAEFTVLVEITENTGITSTKARVTYDPAILTYVSASTDTSVLKDATITVNNSTPGKVIVSVGSFSSMTAANPTIYTSTGSFLELTFKVNDGAADGTTDIVYETIQAIKRVNSVSDTEFNAPTVTKAIVIGEGGHTVHTAGTPVKENEIAATCVSVGSYESVEYCTECNIEMKRTVMIVPATNVHTPGEAVEENLVLGNCKNPATNDVVVYCTICSAEMSRIKVIGEKGPHGHGIPEVIHNPATCTQKGSIVEITKCSICSEELSREINDLPMADHTPGATVKENEVAATCNNEGSYSNVVYCTACNFKMSSVDVTVPRLSHVLADAVRENEVAPTCTLGGHYDLVVYCTVCKQKVSTETKTTEKLTHVPAAAVIENRREPVNCGADGSYESVVYCSLCKAELSRVVQIIEAPEHTKGPAATETTAQICTVCNAILVPPIGHTHKWASTWTSDGVAHWHACSGCSEKKDYEQHHYANACDSDCNICGTVRNNAGHNYANDCDDTCNKCGEKRVVVGHVYDNDCDANCNTCGEVRSTSHKFDTVCDADCNVCGATRTPADHVYGNWKTVTEPTETAEGLRERSCIVCSFKQTESIEALGVTTTEPEVTTDAPVTGEVTTEPAGTTDNTDTPVTSDTPVVTDPIVTDEVTEPSEGTTADVVEEKGCGSVISASIAIVAILGTAVIMKKRD